MTAGVYMIARLNFLYVMAPTTMVVVALVGVLTALFAATIGCVQNDIKRVLAYSTVSQLGYMFVGVGVGAFAAGIFHLMTHAFFKALLFLGSGQRHARDERRAGHAEDGRPARSTSPSPTGRSWSALHRHRGRPRLLRLLQQGRDPVEGLRQLRRQPRLLDASAPSPRA